jgi:hypothetical protein
MGERMESYKHKYAKSVLAGWLREKKEIVLEEYPFCVDEGNNLIGNDPVWAEVDACGHLKSWSGKGCGAPPTYDELLAAKLLPIAIFDIAVEHKGLITYAIEVVHRNDVSNKKLEYLKRINLWYGVYKIDADWILSRCGCPLKIELERII